MWLDQCQKAFKTLRDALMKSPILFHPDANKPYTLFIDALKKVWSTVLTQEHATIIDDKNLSHPHPVINVRGLFYGNLLNWVSLTKEACDIYGSYRIILLFGRSYYHLME